MFCVLGWQEMPLRGVPAPPGGENTASGVVLSTIKPPSGMSQSLRVASVEHVYIRFF